MLHWPEDSKNSFNGCFCLLKMIIYFLLFRKITSKNLSYFLAMIITSRLIYSDNQNYYTMIFFLMMDFTNFSLSVWKLLSCYTDQRTSFLPRIWSYSKIWPSFKWHTFLLNYLRALKIDTSILILPFSYSAVS